MNSSKIYKFKLQDIDFSITIDNSFSAPTVKESDIYAKGLHCHALYELFFVGDKPLVILNESTPFEYKNCIVCIPPLFVHNSERISDHRILFSYSAPKNKSSVSEFFDSFLDKNLPFSINMEECQKTYITEILSELYNPSQASKEVIASLLKLIFHNIYKSNTSTKEKTTSESSDSYFITIDEIVGDYQQDINLKFLSDALNLSTKQTSRIIRKYYKTTLSALVTAKRLGVAASLLANSDMPVADIIEHINFPSESYFYSQFKKTYGTTPLKYRKTKSEKNK